MSWESGGRIQSADPTTEEHPLRDLPVGIKLIGLFYGLQMVLFLLASGELAGVGHPIASTVGGLLFLLGVGGLVSVVGLFTLKPWGYLGVFAVTVLIGIVHLLLLNLVFIVITHLVVYTLLQYGHLYVDSDAGDG